MDLTTSSTLQDEEKGRLVRNTEAGQTVAVLMVVCSCSNGELDKMR